MFKKKNLLIILMSLFFGLVNVSPCLAIIEVKPVTNNCSLESFKLEDLVNHEDIQEYIQEYAAQNNYDDEINNFIQNNQTNESKNKNLLDNNEFSDNSEIIDEKTKSEIAERYDIPRINSNKSNSETYVLVKRGDKDMPSAVSNVWYLTYSAENDGFHVNILNIGLDKIDSVKGKIKLLKINKTAWSANTPVTFSKVNVGQGNVYKYLVNRTAVAEKFEYDITVTEDKQVWNYNNEGKDTYERYSFSVDLYNIMDANGGERHHFISSNSLGKAGFNTDKAPVIRMLLADHHNTANWGNYTSSNKFRDEELKLLKAKDYKALLKMEIDSFKESADSEGKFSNLAEKYNQNDELIFLVAAYEKYFGISI